MIITCCVHSTFEHLECGLTSEVIMIQAVVLEQFYLPEHKLTRRYTIFIVDWDE